MGIGLIFSYYYWNLKTAIKLFTIGISILTMDKILQLLVSAVNKGGDLNQPATQLDKKKNRFCLMVNIHHGMIKENLELNRNGIRENLFIINPTAKQVSFGCI